MKKRLNRSGLTLVEILVALTILGVATAALAALASMSTTSTTGSKDRTTAVTLAAQKLEELRRVPYDDLPIASANDPSGVASDGSSGGVYEREWDVTATTIGVAPGKRIDVTVRWPRGDVSLATQVVEVSDVSVDWHMQAFPSVQVRSWRQQ